MENILKMRKALSNLTDRQFKAIWYVAVDAVPDGTVGTDGNIGK